MNYFRIFLFVLMCLTLSTLAVMVVGGGFKTIVLTSVSIIIGYAYGTFQAIHVYKEKANDAIRELEDAEK